MATTLGIEPGHCAIPAAQRPVAGVNYIIQTFNSKSLSCCCSFESCCVAFLRSLSFSSLIKRSTTNISHRCFRSISFNTPSYQMNHGYDIFINTLLTISIYHTSESFTCVVLVVFFARVDWLARR